MMEPTFTVGVEEEYLTVDRTTLDLRPRGDRVLAAARPVLGAAVQAELNLAQIEVATPVCHTMEQVDNELRRLRASLTRAAATRRTAIAATGTHPCAEWLSQAITPVDRFLELEEDYQQLAREQLICGCHIHIGIDDPDEQIRVMDGIRPWVPVLLAFGANSPYWQGVDTGYASYRTQVFDRWPTAGPAPQCRDREGYEQVVAELVEVGMIPDETYLYWHVRPSSRYPTIELRVADVALTAEEAVTLAALFRALARASYRARIAAPEASHELVRAATWRACRYGMEGRLIDVSRGEEVPAEEMMRRLLVHVRPGCDDRDEWVQICDRVEGTLARGNGAQRQRAALRASGSLRDVTRMIVRETAHGSDPAAFGHGPTTGASA